MGDFYGMEAAYWKAESVLEVSLSIVVRNCTSPAESDLDLRGRQLAIRCISSSVGHISYIIVGIYSDIEALASSQGRVEQITPHVSGHAHLQ